jgi:hypothetical protein
MCREPAHLANERFRLSGTLERHERFGDDPPLGGSGPDDCS